MFILEVCLWQMIWFELIHIQFLKFKYHKYISFKSSSIWHGIKHAYHALLESTFWAFDECDYINFWNDR